jgi:trans-2,3-dihydro-3-hydroxyanthranilate isomerase
MGADHMRTAQMQAIAREFNLSETVFVSQPAIERHTAALRIFTPRTELPFAGHPTVGAAVLLGLQQRASAVRLEEKVGLITCVMERVSKSVGYARFGLPVLPKRLGDAPPAEIMAVPLGIEPEEVGFGDFVPGIYTAGLPFYLVPVRNTEVLARIKPDRRGWSDIFDKDRNSVYVFTKAEGERGVDYAARMFSPGTPLGEDPATGSAASALLGLLAENDPMVDGKTELVLRQGQEMGRPSRLDLTFTKRDGVLTHAGIGGQAVIVAEGTLMVG